MKRPSLVAIIGKPNSGKSTLFNRIVGGRKAITFATPGVTRDRMEEQVTWNGVEFTLVDTGGFILDHEDPLQRQIIKNIKKAADQSGVIVFLVDVDTGITADDENLLRELRADGDKMILTVNKVESEEDGWNIHEFHKLGFDSLHAISALHGKGVGELLDEIVSRLPRKPAPKERDALKVAIVGKPNVGKSSLVNALAGEERHIVAEEPGTTRDSINIRVKYRGKDVIFIDTAGIKRRSQTKGGLQIISSLKSLKSIKAADIVLMLVDASSEISRQDTRIAAEGHRARKGMVLLLNKWDLIDKKRDTIGEYVKRVRDGMPFLTYAPIMTVSALTGLRIEKLIPLCFTIQAQRCKKVETKDLNRLIERIISAQPPKFYRGGTGKIYYATQTGIKPPTFTLFVNNSLYFPRSYRRYINNQIRKLFTFEGTAVRITLKSKRR